MFRHLETIGEDCILFAGGRDEIQRMLIFLEVGDRHDNERLGAATLMERPVCGEEADMANEISNKIRIEPKIQSRNPQTIVRS